MTSLKLLKSKTSDLLSNVVLITCLSILFTEILNICQNLKSLDADIRKMLLMKDRSFFYELRAYFICVKVGEILSLQPVFSLCHAIATLCLLIAITNVCTDARIALCEDIRCVGLCKHTIK